MSHHTHACPAVHQCGSAGSQSTYGLFILIELRHFVSHQPGPKSLFMLRVCTRSLTNTHTHTHTPLCFPANTFAKLTIPQEHSCYWFRLSVRSLQSSSQWHTPQTHAEHHKQLELPSSFLFSPPLIWNCSLQAMNVNLVLLTVIERLNKHLIKKEITGVVFLCSLRVWNTLNIQPITIRPSVICPVVRHKAAISRRKTMQPIWQTLHYIEFKDSTWRLVICKYNFFH